MQELHTRYYEPLAEVKPSIDALLEGLPVKKLLFMTHPARIEALVKPHWMVDLSLWHSEGTTCPVQVVGSRRSCAPGSLHPMRAPDGHESSDMSHRPSSGHGGQCHASSEEPEVLQCCP